MVSSTPPPQFTHEKDPVPILQEAGWAPGPVWTGGKSRPHRDSILDRPARSSVATLSELPGTPTLYLCVLYLSKNKQRLAPLTAKPSQAKVLTGGGDLREAQVDVPLSVSHSCV